ncbi:MAG: glycosyl hydrolase family 43 [Nitrospirae bacterium]|nr:glycosyl hydrolase family 43 [Nitrospirota bacterium]
MALVLGGLPACEGERRDETTGCLCRGWTDHAANPLIQPPPGEPIVADPTVILPEASPDGHWHLFAHSLLGIRHYVSEDGVVWEAAPGRQPLFAGARPYVYREAGTYYLLYELFSGVTLGSSTLNMRSSTDLRQFGEATTILQPTLDWERGFQSTNGNPFLMKVGDEYWLYYSADGVLQPDTGFSEPKHIGLARGSAVTGPYEKLDRPLLGPSATDPFANQAAGSIKVFEEKWRGLWLAFNNGIYVDAEGHSRSAIRLMTSSDGIEWTPLCTAPVVSPEGEGWKRAFVYAFDVKRVGRELWMYYNARDGWREGVERIGLATHGAPDDLSDLDACP